jgi:hypothetical protein
MKTNVPDLDGPWPNKPVAGFLDCGAPHTRQPGRCRGHPGYMLL